MTTPSYVLNLAPARWIWLPSARCLPNTFVLFRRELKVTKVLRKATGWLTADSRYRLTVNGRRIQWGPAPCDPRWQEADPMDLTAALAAGENVVGVEVCYYGQGDGTWPMGAPGFLFRLDLAYTDGTTEQIVSDANWLCFLDRAHRPGMYKRWFLRALQEEFDARLHPYGWDTPMFRPDGQWVPSMLLRGAPDRPAIFAGGPEYVLYPEDPTIHAAAGFLADTDRVALRAREIPLLDEARIIAAKQMTECGRVRWKRDPLDWFESRMPDSFEIQREPAAVRPGPDKDSWVVPATPTPQDACFLTFELPEQMVGWPRCTVDAPAGTTIEMIVHESHDPVKGPAWLDSYIYHWSRFVCREGVNDIEPFDFECFKWLQLHIRNAARPVTVRAVGVRRRLYPWPNQPRVECSEPALQKLFDAGINTMRNSCQDSVYDGAGRERQQYSGDCGHQLHAVRYAFGETRQPARFLKTYSQGMTIDGYFLDCWPAFDRLARLMQRQMGTTVWGPLLDHGVGFNFDCWNHYWETGDAEALREPYPRLVKFAGYLDKLRRADGLLPVVDVGVPAVWIDHIAYKQQRHKQCAFNLYAAAALQHALPHIAELFGEQDKAAQFARLGQELQQAAVRTFWDPARRTLVANRPWLEDDQGLRLCDRSLATAILFDQCPNGDTAAALKALAECPPEMGLSYPANANWRLWALAKLGRTDVVLQDFRTRWATMKSVLVNNTLQENWHTELDSGDEFSHCPLAPIFVLYMDIAGIRATRPGFARCEIRPQLAGWPDLRLTAHTVRGPIQFEAEAAQSGHELRLQVPESIEATLLLAGRSPQAIRGSATAFCAG